MSKSLIAYLVCVIILLTGGLIYYPKWKLDRSEATISWDVSGYYYYLPAFLIYHDAKKLSWHDEILEKYFPAPGDQAFLHESGNMVMKYSIGLSLQYLPFFLIADFLAPLSGYEADGFSRPYQLAISLGSLLIACLGLWFLRLALRKYFSEGIVAVVLIAIVFATNYLDYASINHAMTHNYLFTWYAALILLSQRYWQAPTVSIAMVIGLVTGLMALTRPTEIIAILLPLLWGIDSMSSLKDRIDFFRKHWLHVFIAAATFACIGLIQVVYWKYATGEWIVYSYQEQGFSWLSPHILNGMFSYRAGWLIYTPVMVFSLIGFYFLWKKDRKLFFPVFVVSMIFMYLTWAWDIWWYGGSLGQRSMVQLYAVLAFPLAACAEKFITGKYWKIISAIMLVFCIWYNLWLTHHAHRGGLIRAGEMTGAYFWKVVGRSQVEEEAQFLMDSPEWYHGLSSGREILTENFETLDSTSQCGIPPISGSRSGCIGPHQEFLPMIRFDVPDDAHWLRATATVRCAQKEWDTWKMAQLRLHLTKADNTVKTREIRLYRVLHDGETQRVSIDLRIPKDFDFDQGAVDMWNAGSTKQIIIDDLSIVAF